MYILFDIGGSKMRVAPSRDCLEFAAEPRIEKTPKDFEEGFELLVTMIRDAAQGEKIEIIGGGIGGPFLEKTCSLIASPQLSGWVGKNLGEKLRETFSAQVYIENDSAVVGLGEMKYGAGRGYDIGVYITVSTGVGGAKFEHGMIDSKAAVFEPGHQIIDAGGALCPDCTGTTLWHHISGQATEERVGKKPYEVVDEAFWDEYAKWLAIGLHNTTLHWSPDVIVLGGSMIIGDPAISVEKTTEYMRASLKEILPTAPELKKAELQDHGGLYGAMAFVDQKR